MRRAARRDANHAALVAELRRLEVQVTDLASYGGGCPDIYCSFPGERGLFVEIKNPLTRPTKPRGASNAAKLARQAAWRDRHTGCVITATTADEVIAALMVESRRGL